MCQNAGNLIDVEARGGCSPRFPQRIRLAETRPCDTKGDDKKKETQTKDAETLKLTLQIQGIVPSRDLKLDKTQSGAQSEAARESTCGWPMQLL